MPKYHWLPFFDDVISGSRLPASFFVDGEASISLAATIVPPRRTLAARFQMRRHCRKHRLRQVMTLEQMAEVQDRGLVGDSVATKLEAAECAHGLDVVERLLGAGIGERVPLLQAVDAQHHADRETAAARPSGRSSGSAARSPLRALPTAPPPPSPTGTRPASCASSSPRSRATQSSADPMPAPSNQQHQCAMIQRLFRGSLATTKQRC